MTHIGDIGYDSIGKAGTPWCTHKQTTKTRQLRFLLVFLPVELNPHNSSSFLRTVKFELNEMIKIFRTG